MFKDQSSANANYTIRSEIAAINGRPPEAPITDDLPRLKTNDKW